jgi:NTP pyrophosphatase (non-canonical NTP hydrolase)
MNELSANITRLNEFLNQQTDHSPNERTLMQTMKITEEVGELNEAVLQELGGQMRSKAGKNLDVGSEIADVIICTLLVAERLNVDTWKEVDTKMKKVLERMN